ncbi:hypothetical protein MMC34_005767 [Xylographa carneopallida]|nr:hypothetical protein [Xylographa carneopallida]
MQEHIRRAHAAHYIPKLPATEESFQLMINTPPHVRPPIVPPEPPGTTSRTLGGLHENQRLNNTSYGHDRDAHSLGYSSPMPPRNLEDAYPAAATAAVALAQLHNTRPDSDWDSDVDTEPARHAMNSSIELPPLQNSYPHERFPPFQSPRPRELLPSIMANSPPGRSTTLPPFQKPRPRKPSLTKPSLSQTARLPKHERRKSKDHARRMSIEGRKAFSAEPPNATSSTGSRWEDLVEAAASANEADSDRDLTPVRSFRSADHNPTDETKIPQSPASFKRSSLPPFAPAMNHFDTYKASPLQNTLTLTPPPPDDGVEPFPSVESSMESSHSGHNFHMRSSGLSNSDTSPTFPRLVEVYCARCHRVTPLKDSYACTECIRAFCSDCVYVLNNESQRGLPCQKCGAPTPRYNRFHLEFR